MGDAANNSGREDITGASVGHPGGKGTSTVTPAGRYVPPHQRNRNTNSDSSGTCNGSGGQDGRGDLGHDDRHFPGSSDRGGSRFDGAGGSSGAEGMNGRASYNGRGGQQSERSGNCCSVGDRWKRLDDSGGDDSRRFNSGNRDGRGGGASYSLDDRNSDRFKGRNEGGGAANDRWSKLEHGGTSNHALSSPLGTGWDVRDGRRFYRENEKEVFAHVKEKATGINFDSYDNIPVETTGNDAESIRPIDNFQSTRGVHPLLMENVKRVNYQRPTPVQKHSIPTILEGRDLMGCAQTGSGKTAAFLFPIITNMLRRGPPASPPVQAMFARRPPAYPVCLVVSPTRELAVQILEEARKFVFGTGIRTAVLYGGGDAKSQIIELEKGCDLCVATPGRLTDFLDRKKIRLALVTYLVLDEADRMLDMGFAPQISAIVKESDMPTSYEGRQTIMFSATFPREMQQLAREFLMNYIFLAVGRVGSTNEFIQQRLLYADEDQKPKYLVKLLKEQGQGLVLIFVETKKKADMIEDFLVDEDFPAISIHGDRSQDDREEALRLFKSGKRPILVATDVAARGLDISNITHVVNCDLPNNIEDYVHRIGRTGRAGNMGLATSFVNDNNRPILRDLRNILEEANQEVPSWLSSLMSSMGSSSSRGGGRSFGGGSRGGKSGSMANGSARSAPAFGSRDIRGSEGVSYNHGKGFGNADGGAGGGGMRKATKVNSGFASDLGGLREDAW